MTTNNVAQTQQNSATAQKNIESNLLAPQMSQACEAQRSKEEFEAEVRQHAQVVGQYIASVELGREFKFPTKHLVTAIRELRWKGRLNTLSIPGLHEGHKLRLELTLYHHETDLMEQAQLRAEIEKAYQIYGKSFDRAYNAFLGNSENQEWTASVIREKLEKIAHQNFSESDRKLTISELAQESRWPIGQLNSIYADIVAELDERDSQQTTKAEIEQILQANQSSINLSEVLPENLARPLTQFALWMNLRPDVCLMTLLGTGSSLHRTDTELLAATATDYRLSPNLFIGLVAESSQKKSPILKAIATKPLGLLHRDECDRYEQEMATWQEACKRIQSEDKHAELPPEPQKRVHWLQRTTGEALLRQAGRQQHGMLYLADELKALFGSLNSYRGGRGSDEEDLLELYDGSGAKTLRAEGLRDDTDKTCLGIVGAIQPEILEKLISNGGGGDGNGKWARFFFVHQPNTASTLPISGGLNLTEMLAGLYRSISALPAIEYRFDSAAQLRFKQAYDRVEQLRVKETNQSLRAVYGKTAGRIGKIALNLHIIRWAAGDRAQPISHEIGMESLLPAIKLANFAIQQIKSLYGQFDDDSLTPHLMKILNLAESKGDWIKARDIQPAFTKKQRPSADQVRQYFVTLADMGKGEIQGEGRNLQFRFCQQTADIADENADKLSAAKSLTTQEIQQFADIADIADDSKEICISEIVTDTTGSSETCPASHKNEVQSSVSAANTSVESSPVAESVINVSADENADILSATKSLTVQEVQPTADIADDSEKEAIKTLAEKSTKLLQELQRLCYPSMTKDELKKRFRNLFQARYGVKARCQMNMSQLQDLIDFLTYWLRTGAKFKPQEWTLE